MFNCNATNPQEAYHSKESESYVYLANERVKKLCVCMLPCSFKLNMNLFEFEKITLRMMTFFFLILPLRTVGNKILPRIEQTHFDFKPLWLWCCSVSPKYTPLNLKDSILVAQAQALHFKLFFSSDLWNVHFLTKGVFRHMCILTSPSIPRLLAVNNCRIRSVSLFSFHLYTRPTAVVLKPL